MGDLPVLILLGHHVLAHAACVRKRICAKECVLAIDTAYDDDDDDAAAWEKGRSEMNGRK